MRTHRKLWKITFNIIVLLILCSTIPAWADIDGDGVYDSDDNCPFTLNSDQLDINLNNIGDVCEDNIALLSQAQNCTRLSSQTVADSSAQLCQDVTNIMENGPDFWLSQSSYIIRSKGKFDILSLRSETDSTQISSLTLSIWADMPEVDWSSQTIKVYAYDADGDSVQTSNSLSFMINGNSVGWHVLDLTPLLPLMDGFGFVKFRLVNVNKELGIAEAYLKIPPPVNAPNIYISPASLDYGTIDEGTTSLLSTTVSNDGTGDLVIGTITNPTSTYLITSDGCTGQTLVPAATCLLNVEFAPITAGTFNDAITIPSNDPDSPNTILSLNGIATTPPLDAQEISVTPSSLDFGTVDVGVSSSLITTVSNIGTDDLVIETIANPSTPYSIMSDNCSGQTLSASASCSVTVKFNSPSEGTFPDTLSIPSNDADNPNVSISLSGTAIIPDTMETIRPTDAYNPDGWINPYSGYDGNTDTYSSKVTPNATPSISYGGSSSDETVNSWQSKSNYWNAAWVIITFERFNSVDDKVDVVITDQNGNIVHTLLTATIYSVSKNEYAKRLNMTDWGDGFSNIDTLRVRINGDKKKGADGTETRVFDIRIVGDSSLFEEDFTRGDYTSLPLDDSNLMTDYSPDQITDVLSDDNLRVSQGVPTNLYAVHLFKKKTTSRNVSITWKGQLDHTGQVSSGLSFKPTVSGNLTKVSIAIGDWFDYPYVEPNPQGYVRVRLKSEIGGKVLAESDPVAESVVVNSGTFIFSTPYRVAQGVTYYFEIWRDHYDEEYKLTLECADQIYIDGSYFYRRGGIWLESDNNCIFSWYIDDILDTIVYPSNTTEYGLEGLDWNNIYLEVYNRATLSWEQMDSKLYDGSADDLSLSANIFSDDYYDLNNWISVRIYADSNANDYRFDSYSLKADYIDISSLIDSWEISAEPLDVNFNTLDVGTSSSRDITISNNGIGNLIIGTIANPSAPYSITADGCSGQTLSASALCSVTVEFSPTAEGNFAGSLAIPSNDADNPDFTVNLSGTAVEATLTGTVTNASTSLPLQGVTVTVTDSISSIHSTTTDVNGTYTVPGLSSGNYTADYTLIDYFPQTINGTLTSGQTLTSDVQLLPVTFTISSPSDGTVLDTTPATVTGFVESNSTVTVNGIPATVTGNSYSASVPLVEGQNTITAIATDQFSQTQTLNISVTLVLPITLTITSPQDGSTLNSSPVIVTGDVYNMAGVGGGQESLAQSFKAGRDGKLTKVSLPMYRLGSSGIDKIHVRISTAIGGETIAVSNKVDFNNIPSPTYGWVNFTFAGSNQVDIVNGQTYYMELWREQQDSNNFVSWFFGTLDYYPDGERFIKDNGSWSAPLGAGDFAFEVYLDYAVDQDQLNLGLSNYLNLYGLTSYPVNVTVNGVQANVTDNSFSATVPLTEGSNTITAVASDQYNHTSSESINVSLITKGTITGTATDSSTGLPLEAATVTVTDSLNDTQAVQTAVDGTYTINNISQGAFTGTITKPGYTTYNIADTMTPGQTITIDATISPIFPVISNVSVTDITNDSATITWMTDQSTDSLVDYGTTILYGNSESDPALTTSHSIALTNLNPGTIYHFIVTSTSSYGFSSSSGDNTFTTLSPITITITSPLDSDTVNRADTMVKGTITNSTGNETGVTVNGIVATVYNGEFFVNHVSLQDGQNTVTANATDTAGNSATLAILVDAYSSVPHVTLRANIESGIAPLTTYFSVSTSIPNSVTNYAIDYEGDVVADYSGAAFDDISTIYTTEGVYYPTITVTDDQSNIYTDTIVIIVLNQASLKILLETKWNAVKTALMAGDNATALNYFVDGNRDRYNNVFNNLGTVELNVILSSFEAFELLSQSENMAECGLIRTESTGTFAYPVIFVKDEAGVWKLFGL